MLNAWHRLLVVLSIASVAVILALAGCTTREADQSDDTEPHTTPVAASDLADDDADTRTEQETDRSGSEDAGDDDSASYPVSVTRTDGVELTIEEQPQRIVSLSPGATEVLFEIGAGDQLVAVDMFSDFPTVAHDLPQLDAYQPDPEAILDLEPDLVYVVFDADGIVELLEDLGVPVLFLDAPTSVDGLIEQINALGDVTGNPATASELVIDLESRIDQIIGRIPEHDEGPRVYHELDESLFSVGPNSFVGDLYTLLGAENIAEGAISDYPQLSEEVILEEDPDVIIVASHGPPDGTAADSLRQRPGWSAVQAVRNDRVHEIDGDIISRPGPRIIEALEQLAELLYPEEFESIHGIPVAHGDLDVAAAA